ncbi:hypothetical protein [Pseudonocardia sp.]|uniref:hypothetical protein n=1 Tax=Pseudonocardia sp. TaxID=60912 RepID=UPI00261195C5|nr:hypothetical protein [Pseudonocardia sp.]
MSVPGRVPRPPRRGLRTAVPTGVATALAVTAHVLAGGTARPATVALALLVAAVPAWLLTARERGWLAISAAQLGLQLVVHGVLAQADPAPHVHLVPHDLMLHAHVLAALLAAAVLRLGERRAWAVARRLSARVAAWWRRLAAGVPPVAGPASPRLARTSRPGALRLLLRHSRALRGPPPLPA